MRRDVTAKLGAAARLPQTMRFPTGKRGDYLEVKHQMALTFTLGGVPLLDSFLVADDLSEEAVIGARTMQKWGIRLDPEREAVVLDPRAKRLRFVAFQ